MHTATLLAHPPGIPDDPFNASTPPLYLASTYHQPDAEISGPYDYARSGNPTRDALEALLARLEGVDTRAFAFASGLAAIAAVCRSLRPGDELLANDDLYGGTYRFLSRLLEPTGVSIRFADLTDLDAAAGAISSRTRLVLVESLSNPMLRVPDLRSLARLAHDAGARLAVDNTALSPVLCRPLDLGADYSIQSATKYLSGHSDLTAGVVAVRDAALGEALYLVQNGEGAALAPTDCYLLHRGVQTLDLRLERQQRSALQLAQWLADRPEVSWVAFPGLDDHPGRALHESQSSGTGSVLSFRTGSVERSVAIVESLRLFPLRVSFGALGSSAALPCRMSHASIPADVRQSREFPEDLVRLSVGIEHPDDLVADLSQAFAKAFAATLTPASAAR
jgi:cystathionine beta-lyase